MKTTGLCHTSYYTHVVDSRVVFCSSLTEEVVFGVGHSQEQQASESLCLKMRVLIE